MENNVLDADELVHRENTKASTPTSDQTTNSEPEMRKTCTPSCDVGSGPPQPPKLVSSAAVTQITQLIDTHHLSREQLIKIYDDHIEQKLHAAGSHDDHVTEEHTSEDGDVMACEPSGPVMMYRDSPPPLTSVVRAVKEGVSLPPEIGQKRKHFTLEEELKEPQVSSFVECLLERDQSVVAQVIKRYMTQYSIPQREVVESTSLNQSHLSQHFLHGVTMKKAKRVKLYQWFEEDQKTRTGKVQNADGSLSAVLESPRVEGKRRPRWKWSPISTQILTEAFKKNQFPTRDQRVDLARICNEAEVTMNNGAQVRGPEGDTEGITEQRVNTWFTNRRKGLGTPITPPPTKVSTPAGTPLYPHMLSHPLLRASPVTTPMSRPPPSSYKSISPQRGAGLLGRSPSSERTPTPTTLQSLVSQIQESQVSQQGGGVVPIPSLLSRPPVAMPLAIALPGTPGGSHNNLLRSPSAVSTTHTKTPSPAHHTPLQTVTMPINLSPALISPSQVQALITQFHSPLITTSPTSKMSHDLSQDRTTKSHDQHATSPLTVQSVTIASDPNVLAQGTSPTSQEAVDPKGLTQIGGLVLNSSQLQAFINQLHAQQKLAADGIQIVTALPGYSAVTTD